MIIQKKNGQTQKCQHSFNTFDRLMHRIVPHDWYKKMSFIILEGFYTTQNEVILNKTNQFINSE